MIERVACRKRRTRYFTNDFKVFSGYRQPKAAVARNIKQAHA